MKLNPIASNMTELYTAGITVLFSYKTPVAAKIGEVAYYKTDCTWSRTTSKHINKWLNGHTAEYRSQDFFDRLAISL